MPDIKTVFDAAHAHVMKWEGGFFDHKNDPGGVTNFGVSLMFLKGFGVLEGDIDGDGDIDRDDVLAITKENAHELFQRHFWNKPRAAELPPLVAVCFYDLAVNAGAGRSALIVQEGIIRWCRKGDVFAVFQNLQLAGFQRQQPLGIRFLPIHVVVDRAAYKTGKHSCDLLAIQFGVIVLIQNKQLGQHRRIVQKTTQLASFNGVNDVQNRLCGHTHLLATYANLRRIAGMAFVKVIGHAPSDAVEVGTPDSVSMPCRMTFPAPIIRLSCRGSISEGSIWSWRGTDSPSCFKRGRKRKNTSAAMNSSRAARRSELSLSTVDHRNPTFNSRFA